MSGEALIYDAELDPTKDDIAARYAGIVTLLGSYRLVDPDGEVGIEVLIGSDLDGRGVQLPLTYRPSELDSRHTLLEMDHSELGRRWVSNALGDPVAVTQFIRTIMEGDDGATRSDGIPAALDIRGSGKSEKVDITDVTLTEVTRQRAVGHAKFDGKLRNFQLIVPHLLRRLNLTGVDANTARLHLVGWLPSMPEKQRVCAELSVRE
ncbi:CG0192 family protein [Corynebacterium nasicanis]|uniref:Maltokinase N-terminal cap domain-containing protein n=1 Tax=Corynebacterium nasicanis TaxID=1448267 RepID=A0ABW1QEW5_9CORY